MKPLTDKVDELFVEWDRPDSPGCALGVIYNGHLIYKRGYGMANLEHNIPISSDTVFRMQALQAATAWPAEVMGWEEIGTLAPGKLADLIAVAGDPLADIGVMKDVPLVVHEGIVVKNEPAAADA